MNTVFLMQKISPCIFGNLPRQAPSTTRMKRLNLFLVLHGIAHARTLEIALTGFVSGLEKGGCLGSEVVIECPEGERINIEGELYGLPASARTCAPGEGDICVIPSHSHGSVVKEVWQMTFSEFCFFSHAIHNC